MKRNLFTSRLGRSAITAAVVVMATALVAACGSTSSGDDAAGSSGSSSTSKSDGAISIRLPLTTDLSALPNMVAIDKGFFAEHGLNVKGAKVTDTTTLPSLAGHTFDVVCLTPTQFISAVSSGIDLTTISTLTVDTPDQQTGALLVPKDSPITSVKDLAGKTIGTPSVTGTMILATKKLLKDAGGDPQSLRPLQAPAAQLGDLLTAGKFDAITALEPTMSSLIKKGFRNLGDPFRAIGDKSANGVCVAPTSFVKAHPQLAEDYRAALTEAGQYMASNAADASSIFVKNSGVPAALLQGVTLPGVNSEVLPDDITAWQNLMSEMGILKKTIDVNSHVA